MEQLYAEQVMEAKRRRVMLRIEVVVVDLHHTRSVPLNTCHEK